jgi:predicted metal-dependent hydrolase
MSKIASTTTRHLQIHYGKDSFDVTVMFVSSDRLTISVHPDMTVTAAAPRGREFEAISNRIRARAAWIVRQRVRFERLRPLPTPRRYVSGETCLYLGRQYRLKVVAAIQNEVKLQGGYICVSTPSPSSQAVVRQLLRKWYRARAEIVLPQRLAACFGASRTLGVELPALSLRQMRTRWGSCSRAKHILLNPDLIKVPQYCIDYVIFHELCHLKVMRHDRVFYKTLGRYMPDWAHWKERLERFVLPES